MTPAAVRPSASLGRISSCSGLPPHLQYLRQAKFSFPCLRTASIGISLYPVDGDTLQQSLKTADQAMYHAKGQGKNMYALYAA